MTSVLDQLAALLGCRVDRTEFGYPDELHVHFDPHAHYVLATAASGWRLAQGPGAVVAEAEPDARLPNRTEQEAALEVLVGTRLAILADARERTMRQWTIDVPGSLQLEGEGGGDVVLATADRPVGQNRVLDRMTGPFVVVLP